MDSNESARMEERYPYHQKPLRSQHSEIRVLRFDGGEIVPGKPLECTFLVLSLDPSPPPGAWPVDESACESLAKGLAYSAVSYTWGHNTETALMKIDRHSVQVPLNTEIALCRLLMHKSRDPEDPPPLLWIDALCIDQENLEEKSQQVAMMGQVYSCAEEVLVWLGEDNNGHGPELTDLLKEIYDDCALATDDFAKLQDTFYPKNEVGVRLVVHRHLWSGALKTHIIDRSDFTLAKWRLLIEFYSLRWFSRVWIVQEVLKAKKATIHWGDVSISWPVVSLAAQWMQYGSNGTTSIEDVQVLYAVGQTIAAVSHATILYTMGSFALGSARGGVGTASEYTLASLLFNSAAFNTTDARDSVYALLGLLSPRARRTVESCADMVPDYSFDVATVFTEATKALISTTRGAGTFLKLAGLHQATQPNCGALPSWVPKWGQRADGSHGNCKPLINPNTSGIFTPPLDVNGMPRFSKILRTKAHFVDTVSIVGPAIPPVNLPHDPSLSEGMFADLAAKILEIRKLAKASTDTIQSSDSLARTLCCGHTADSEPVEKVEGFLAKFEPTLHVYETYHPGMIVPIPVVSFQLAITGNSINRHFIVSSQGRFGMAPPGTQEGDQIAFLFGHAWPFVVRPVEDHWVLIGDVYVDGLVDGLHFAKMRERGVLDKETQWIEIH